MKEVNSHIHGPRMSKCKQHALSLLADDMYIYVQYSTPCCVGAIILRHHFSTACYTRSGHRPFITKPCVPPFWSRGQFLVLVKSTLNITYCLIKYLYCQMKGEWKLYVMFSFARTLDWPSLESLLKVTKFRINWLKITDYLIQKLLHGQIICVVDIIICQWEFPNIKFYLEHLGKEY